jgi:hypothetical protein
MRHPSANMAIEFRVGPFRVCGPFDAEDQVSGKCPHPEGDGQSFFWGLRAEDDGHRVAEHFISERVVAVGMGRCHRIASTTRHTGSKVTTTWRSSLTSVMTQKVIIMRAPFQFIVLSSPTHGRRIGDSSMEVDVEILDVNDAEARALLLSIDLLASFEETQRELHDRLRTLTPTESAEPAALWQATGQVAEQPIFPFDEVRPGRAQYFVLVPCWDEMHQVKLLVRFQAEGLECRVLLS